MDERKVMFPILEPFEFEKHFNAEEALQLREEKWHLTIGYSFIYLVTVFSLKTFMKNRKEFDLIYVLTIWNISLAALSIFATIRMVPGYLHLAWDHGFVFSVCDQSYGLRMLPSVFWGNMFSWLKVIEFGDTIFLVLRKRKLTFLHCYHHAMTTIITEYSAANRIPVGHSFVVTNHFIHSLMYTYYFLMSIRMRLPKIVSISITSLQILQMVLGIVQCYFAFYYRFTREDCNFPLMPIVVVILMYLSYLVLFCNFFHNAYIVNPRKYKMY